MRIMKLLRTLLVTMVGLGLAWNAQAQDVGIMKSNIIPMVGIPAELGSAHDYQEELVEAFVRIYVVQTGVVGFDFFRNGGLPFDWVGGLYWEFNDLRTGSIKVKIFLHDTFTGRFADGTTVDFEFIGIYAPSGLMFQVVPGSEKTLQGEPIAALLPPPDVHVLPRDDLHVDPSGYVDFEQTWMGLHDWGIKYARNQR